MEASLFAIAVWVQVIVRLDSLLLRFISSGIKEARWYNPLIFLVSKEIGAVASYFAPW